RLVCFFQAEDGIRDRTVTGVQTCALPISAHVLPPGAPVDRLDREQTVTKRIARQHLGLYPPHGADEHRLDSLPRVLQGLGQRERSEERRVGKEWRSRRGLCACK